MKVLLVALSLIFSIAARVEAQEFTPLAASRTESLDVDGDGDTDITVPIAACNEGTFKPVICWQDVPKTIAFRPSLPECGGRAAAILKGPLSSSYSVVLRDRANRDRFPPCVKTGSNYGSCSFFQCDTQGLNKCSAFKCQKTIVRGKGRKREKVCCFGDSGNSSVLSKATRLTIKLRDVPGSNLDPLLRIGLKNFSPKEKLN